MLNLALVVGARPNFMKIAPLIRALKERPEVARWRLIHTGQHYDELMNDVFFQELGIPRPDVALMCGGGSHADQTARIMVAFEQELLREPVDVVVVVGDVNSTLACSIVGRKLGSYIAHIEAGLRSHDRNMPEEINRIVTDALSDVFFCTEPAGVANLLAEGKPASRVFDVGHVMIDNLLYQQALLHSSDRGALPAGGLVQSLLAAPEGRYAVATFHRPSNVDTREDLERTVGILRRIGAMLPVIFPVHPRTRANLQRFGLEAGERVHLVDPLSYMAFLNAWSQAAVVVTDSGGLQEETTGLGVPCVTVRENTERPVTVEEGTNILAGTDPDRVVGAVQEVLEGRHRKGRRPVLWDGEAARRIVAVLDQKVWLNTP